MKYKLVRKINGKWTSLSNEENLTKLEVEILKSHMRTLGDRDWIEVQELEAVDILRKKIFLDECELTN